MNLRDRGSVGRKMRLPPYTRLLATLTSRRPAADATPKITKRLVSDPERGRPDRESGIRAEMAPRPINRLSQWGRQPRREDQSKDVRG